VLICNSHISYVLYITPLIYRIVLFYIGRHEGWVTISRSHSRDNFILRAIKNPALTTNASIRVESPITARDALLGHYCIPDVLTLLLCKWLCPHYTLEKQRCVLKPRWDVRGIPEGSFLLGGRVVEGCAAICNTESVYRHMCHRRRPKRFSNGFITSCWIAIKDKVSPAKVARRV
jgi:hypothetical protein